MAVSHVRGLDSGRVDAIHTGDAMWTSRTTIVALVLLGTCAAPRQALWATETVVQQSPEVVRDYDGNTYRTVRIGNQTWMAENLRSTHYSDGTPIRYMDYDGDSSSARTFGRLYAWAVAMNGAASSASNPSGVRGACPAGWHLPSGAEWQQLADFLGGGAVAGGKLKAAGSSLWDSPNTGATDESGFSALPAGL